jgi:hypothetical protein
MMEFIKNHQLLTAFVLGMLTFAIGVSLRFYKADKVMPREKKLEMNMHRAAMALRKLDRAKRVLARFTAVRNIVPGRPATAMIRRMWKATNDASDSKSHLSAVLKKVPGLGASVSLLQNLNSYIDKAERVHQEILHKVHLTDWESTGGVMISQRQINPITSACQDDIEQATAIVNKWAQEIEQGDIEIGRKSDPIIKASGGMLRNPLKPETEIEVGQTESAILLSQTKMDIERVIRCIESIQEAIQAMATPTNYDRHETLGLVANALDSIDNALGDADLPLPQMLASGRTPFDSPKEEKPPGALDRIYSHLVEVEASLTAGEGGS